MTSNSGIGSNANIASYLGPAPKSSASINVLYNVTTSPGAITYAELAIFKGTYLLGGGSGNPVQMVGLGYTDVSGVINTTGVKNTTVNLSPSCAVGDQLWVMFAFNGTGSVQLRAGGNMVYTLGEAMSRSGVQPSTVLSGILLTSSSSVATWWNAFLN